MPDDRPAFYDDPDELRNAWAGVPVSEQDFDTMSREPYCPAPLDVFFSDPDGRDYD